MPRLLLLSVLLLASWPSVAGGQSLGIQASAGVPLRDSGYTAAGGLTIAFNPYLALAVTVDRIHIDDQVTHFPGGMSFSRGGTFTLGSVELQAHPLPGRRLQPYGLAGMAAGRSRLNDGERFPGEGLTDEVIGLFFGGGLKVPVRERFSVFVDFRLMLIAEVRGEGLSAAGPLRAGVSWRF